MSLNTQQRKIGHNAKKLWENPKNVRLPYTAQHIEDRKCVVLGRQKKKKRQGQIKGGKEAAASEKEEKRREEKRTFYQIQERESECKSKLVKPSP